MKLLAEKILTDKSVRQDTAVNELAVQLAAKFSPWANSPTA